MQYSRINRDNIAGFLNYFSGLVGKNFDASQIHKWQQLDDNTRNAYLDKLLDSFGYETEIQKMEVLQGYFTSIQKQPTPQEPARGQNNFQNKNAQESTPELNSSSPAPRKKSGRGSVISVIFFLLLLAGGIYLWMKYSEYQNRDRIYCLANNVSVRKDLSGNETWGTRMDFLGKYRSKDGVISNSNFSLPLVDGEMYNEFYKVYMDTSFLQYLTSPEKAVGYVHSAFVTRNEDEYDKYKRVFHYFEDDYTELQNLSFRYRKILVNTIANFGPLQNKALSPPCYKDKGQASNPKMSIGTKEMKVGLAKQYFVVARIDGLYYSILSNEDATELSVFDTYFESETGKQRLDRPGKFTVNNSSDLVWQDCESEMILHSSSRPYDAFVDPSIRTAPEPIDTAVDYNYQPDEGLNEEVYGD